MPSYAVPFFKGSGPQPPTFTCPNAYASAAVPPKKNKLIDHTLLKPEASESQIRKLCKEAKQYDFASVCINPYWVRLGHELLKDTDVRVCTVVGFPLGASAVASKGLEAVEAVKDGAKEVDMVINVGEIKSKNYQAVEEDVYCVVNSVRAHLANTGADQKTGGVVVKVILECCLLTDEEVVQACRACVAAGADFVKTSTGFNKFGATEHHVKLMRDTVGGKVGVKAAGGVRTAEDMDKMVHAGATRIGTSNGVALMTGGTGAGY
ncbi:hypothetical protein FOZ63_007464 [Perkinsus olseni]|uniref:deoxyribose-phosphate aldolase n=1 Tax=Perkinsus olseni TaxID=32597 RepID=A0A7J6PRB0_PEROL|nr:hypothetical protein FOZ62_023645 [Perkinsus olseni]KAF4747848.1 hypothetical protein FOZ63_007464 [Perkinsus olseni]